MFVRQRLSGVIAVLALVLSACASGAIASDSSTSTSTAPPTTTPATTTTETPPNTTVPPETATTAAPEPIDPVAFRQAMRALWQDHVAWTRMFIVSAVGDLPDTGQVAERLLANQADIGEAVAAFYGDEAGSALTDLLRDHILIAADLVAAAKDGDNAAVVTANAAWYQNADDISAFLAGANPAWPEETLRDMMRGHLDQTLAEATAQLSGDYAASIAEYDHIVTHILQMSDTLSEGIIAQFSDQFS